ncbi:MAG: helix-turn-helix domain-containing protein [Pyrinomonadaceae bacterium]
MNDTITFIPLSKRDIQTLIRKELELFFADRVGVENSEDEIGGVPMAMEVTGLAKATIYAKVSARTIPHRKQGKKLYFSRKELCGWIDAGRRRTRAEIAAEGAANPAYLP